MDISLWHKQPLPNLWFRAFLSTLGGHGLCIVQRASFVRGSILLLPFRDYRSTCLFRRIRDSSISASLFLVRRLKRTVCIQLALLGPVGSYIWPAEKFSFVRYVFLCYFQSKNLLGNVESRACFLCELVERLFRMIGMGSEQAFLGALSYSNVSCARHSVNGVA